MGNQVTYDSEQTQKKSVRYTGTDTLQEGNLLCYDADFAGADATEGKTGDATVRNQLRATRVEKPAVGNLQHFAGVVATGFGGIVGPANIDIFVPTARGQKVSIWTDQNCTIDVTTLHLQAGSYAAGSEANGHRIGKALQTVDRSSTENTVQAILQAPPVVNDTVVTASSRTIVQLPTDAIWRNFPLNDMRTNPFLGTLLDEDFRRPGSAEIARTFTETTGLIVEQAVDIGAIRVFSSVDNEEACLQWDVPIVLSGGQPWAFEARVKVLNITDGTAAVLVGLQAPILLAGNNIVDAGAEPADDPYLGIMRLDADGNIWDFVYNENGQTFNVHDDNYIDMVADTYDTFGMYFDGTTIQGFVNGVSTGTAIIATDISAADFPTAAVVVPTFCLKSGNAADVSADLDWIRVAQL